MSAASKDVAADGAALAIPRNSTRQAEGLRYGDLARLLNRLSGIVIVGFVLVHVVAEAILRVPALSTMKSGIPWLPTVQSQHFIHALIYSSIAYHTLWGLRLLAGDLGARLDYKFSFLAISAVSLVVAAREFLRYVGF